MTALDAPLDGEAHLLKETLSASLTVRAAAVDVFAVLANPANHAAIDRTGWVRASLDERLLTEAGQVFRIAMYHDNHPDGHYEMANKVRVFDPPRTISWEPGQDLRGDGKLQFGGWIWRYDLSATSGSETAVTLSYDWSAVPPALREHISFPPFSPEHLNNSLDHLADIVAARTASLNSLPEIGAPATRALANAGYTTLRQLANLQRSDLARLHGMGPRAMHVIARELAQHGLQLQ